MQDLILAAVVAVMFIFGWFLMKRLDRFLEKKRQAQELRLESGKDTLWIGFSDPSVADSMTDVLTPYSKQGSDISVYLFQGTEKELIKQLSAKKLNVIFLYKDADIPVETHYNIHDEFDAPKPQK